MFLSLALLLLAACQRADPLSLRVESADPRVYSSWRFLKGDELSPVQWKDFDTAVQELRDRFVSLNSDGPRAIEERVLAEIHGHTVQEVVVGGLQHKVTRLQIEQRDLQTAVDNNALIVVGPDDPATARDLAGRTERQIGRLRRCVAELRATERQLAVWEGKPPPPASEDASPAGPRALSREEALGHIDGFLEGRRRGIRRHWGDTPIQIVRTSETLTGSTRDEFEQKRAGAAQKQHVVLAVHLRQHWWIYDGPAAAPTFSDAVLAQLTPDDRERIAAQWLDLKAEEWARNEAWSAMPDGSPDLLRPDLKPDLKRTPPPLPTMDGKVP